MAKKKGKKSKKSKRAIVAIVSELTGHRRITAKNSLNTPFKISLKKFDPIARKVVVYKEVNKNLGRNEVKAKKN